MRDAAAGEALLTGDTQSSRRRPGRDDGDARFDIVDQPEIAARRQGADLAQAELGTGLGGLLLQRWPKVVAGDPLRKTREVVDALDVHELAAGNPGHHHKARETLASREERGREGGHAAPNDRDVDHAVTLAHLHWKTVSTQRHSSTLTVFA